MEILIIDDFREDRSKFSDLHCRMAGPLIRLLHRSVGCAHEAWRNTAHNDHYRGYVADLSKLSPRSLTESYLKIQSKQASMVRVTYTNTSTKPVLPPFSTLYPLQT